MWARPQGAFPDELWAIARAQQQLWNNLVTYREQFRESIKDLPDKERKERWKTDFRPGCHTVVAASSLGWEAKAAVLGRFETASIRAAKAGAELRKQFRLDRINIPHRFTGGGLPIEKFLTQGARAERVKFIMPEQTAYRDKSREALRERFSTGVFGLGSNSFTFDVCVDRQFPPGSIVKQVFWVGDFLASRRRSQIDALSINWQRQIQAGKTTIAEVHERFPRSALDSRWHWSLQVVLEIPPVPKPAHLTPDPRPIAGLDLGWRLMAEGSYLRIGYIADSNGKCFELRLPITYRNQDVKSHRLTPENIYAYHTWLDLIALDEKIGNAIQSVKDQTYEQVPAQYHAGWVKMRQGGLLRMIRDFEETGFTSPAYERLKVWQREYEKWATIRTSLWERLKARQDWWYRNLAAWLTKRYQAIVWEGDLSLKEMAEEKHSLVTEAALKHANKYRGWAALSRLRLYLQQAAEKNWCEIVDAPAANSTLTCWQCGALMTRDGGLLLIKCPNGHEHDQDRNSGEIFLQYGRDALNYTGNGIGHVHTPPIPYPLQQVVISDSAS